MSERKSLSLDDAISRLLDAHCEELRGADMPGEPQIQSVRSRDFPRIWNEQEYGEAWRTLWRYRMLTRGTLPEKGAL